MSITDAEKFKYVVEALKDDTTLEYLYQILKQQENWLKNELDTIRG